VEAVRIEQFIEARLVEDEQIARAASETHGERWSPGAAFGDDWDRVEGAGVMAIAYDMQEAAPPHIARHDPAHVLRQTVALRELLNVANDVDAMYSVAAEDAADGIRKTIAAIWSDHPDYQQEWADTVP
jgi:hypothetical protein